MSRHQENNGEAGRSGPILLNAVVTWFRVHQVAFDQKVADVLCTAAIALYTLGFDERQITDHLIQNYNGPMATKATAPSSSAYH
jgi:hypothetical protein